jgi:acyl-CoA synthetase (NDP forming)
MSAMTIRGCIMYPAHVDASTREELAAYSRKHGTRFLGPNCAGMVSALAGLDITPGGQPAIQDPTGVSVITQSGGTGTELILRFRDLGIGVRDMLSTGDEADATIEEFLLDLLASEPRPSVVLLFTEQFRRPALLLEGLRQAQGLSIPVGVVKVGRSAGAAAAAQSHTGAIVGDFADFRTMAERFGAIVCENVEDLVDLAVAIHANREHPIRGGRVAIVTNSGGAASLSSDLIEGTSVSLAPIVGKMQEVILENLAYPTLILNPLDSANTRGGQILADFVAAAANDDGIDAVILEQKGGIPPGSPQADVIAQLVPSSPKPVVTNWPSMDPEARRRLIAAGSAVFDDTGRMWKTLARIVEWGARRGRADLPALVATPDTAWIAAARASGLALAYADARETLRQGVVTQPRYAVVCNDGDLRQASGFDWPVVLKVSSTELVHKAEVGGVRTGIRNIDELSAEFDDLLARLGAAIVGVVEEQIAEGLELLVSARQTEYGRVLVVGWGGAYCEAIADVATVLEPSSVEDILATLRRTKWWKTYRNPRPPRALASESQIASFILSLLTLLGSRGDFYEVEVNPAIVNADGVFAADARVITFEPPDASGA